VILRISEIFSSIQGEGKFSGTLSDFIRVWGCNIGKDKCPLPCDTPYASDNTNKDYKEMSVSEIINELSKRKGPQAFNVVVTGGEPLVYKDELGELLKDLSFFYSSVEVETNGTIGVKEIREEYGNLEKVFWNISPKIGFFNYNALKSFIESFDKENLRFKFVVENEDELKKYLELVDNLHIPNYLVWLMPKGADVETLNKNSKFVIEKCFEYSFNFSPRLHIYLFGNVRGK
jgi:7-carboxy-7-deazaguanine synthase